MKLLHFLSITFFGLMILMTSCGESDAKQQAREALGDTKTAAESPNKGAANYHYKCPNNCVGGGGDGAGNCPTCGSPLVHNSSFHDAKPAATNEAQTSITEEGVTVTKYPEGTPASAGLMPPSSDIQEPPQNENGVWHFTCPKGCAGGGGLASEKCGGCGGPLAHNAEYHKE